MAKALTDEEREAPKWRGILQLAIVAAVILAAILLARAPRQEFLELDSEAGQAGVAPTATVMQPRMTAASHHPHHFRQHHGR